MSPKIVREYLRGSKDTQQSGRSPDQQHAENAAAIERQGWSLHPSPPYGATDRSASRYATRAREDFKRLVGDLESDDFDADILAMWESSRGSRRVGEWVGSPTTNQRGMFTASRIASTTDGKSLPKLNQAVGSSRARFANASTASRTESGPTTMTGANSPSIRLR